jgi:hypothetical protein
VNNYRSKTGSLFRVSLVIIVLLSVLTKIRNDHDHLPGFTERNIRRYLPANNRNIPRRVRTSRPKISTTEMCAGIFFSYTKHDNETNIEHKLERQRTSNPVVETADQTIQIKGVTSRSQIESVCI